jgi:hypothetical protein
VGGRKSIPLEQSQPKKENTEENYRGGIGNLETGKKAAIFHVRVSLLVTSNSLLLVAVLLHNSNYMYS